MRPFRPLPLTSFKGTPSSRANLRTEGEAWGKPSVVPPGACAGATGALATETGAAPALLAGTAAVFPTAAGAGVAGAAGVVPPATLPSRITTKSPILTVSPSFTLISLTRPAAPDGISIDALSDSTVIRLCSSLMVSPTLTNSSITATSFKSPMSGMRTSIGPEASVRTELVEVLTGASTGSARTGDATETGATPALLAGATA